MSDHGHGHGHGHGHKAHTDFGRYSHPELVSMLHAGDPKSAVSAAETWGAAGAALHERAGDVEKQMREFEQWWDGSAARQYKIMINDLTSGIRQVANTAYELRDLTYASAEALSDAQTKMPAPVPVPDLAPSVIAAATTPLVVGAGTAAAVVESLRLAQAQAVAQVRQQQATQAAADAAHQQAVQVMTELAGTYTAVEQSMPATPTAASPPQATAVGADTGADLILPAGSTGSLDQAASILPIGATPAPGTSISTSTSTATPPLFSTMFTAGLAAASAALGGRFVTIPSRIGLGGKSGTDDKQGTATGTGSGTGDGTDAKDASDAKDARDLKGGRTAGGGFGGAGLGGGLGTALNNLPVANPALATAAGAGAVSSLAGAAGVSAAAAGSRGMGGGFMPMMPYAPMGAGEAGTGRRIPPWLVETEDVWGEQSVVTPAVIGEDSQASPSSTRPWQ